MNLCKELSGSEILVARLKHFDELVEIRGKGTTFINGEFSNCRLRFDLFLLAFYHSIMSN